MLRAPGTGPSRYVVRSRERRVNTIPDPTVSAPKALELKPRRRYEHDGGVLVPGDQKRKRQRAAIGEDRLRFPEVGDPDVALYFGNPRGAARELLHSSEDDP